MPCEAGVEASFIRCQALCSKLAVELILLLARLGHKNGFPKEKKENPGCFGFHCCFSSSLLSENIFAVSAVQGARVLSKYPACKWNAVTLRLREREGEGGADKQEEENLERGGLESVNCRAEKCLANSGQTLHWQSPCKTVWFAE